MFDFKNILILVVSVAIVVIFGYIMLLMLEPSPYGEMVATHVKSDNDKAAAQIIATVKSKPGCGKLDFPYTSLMKYYKSQECYMLKTEMQKHRRPTDGELLSHGKGFMTGFSQKLKTCMLPENRQKLMKRIESGQNLRAFLDEIDRSKDVPGRLDRVRHKMMCGS